MHYPRGEPLTPRDQHVLENVHPQDWEPIVVSVRLALHSRLSTNDIAWLPPLSWAALFGDNLRQFGERRIPLQLSESVHELLDTQKAMPSIRTRYLAVESLIPGLPGADRESSQLGECAVRSDLEAVQRTSCGGRTCWDVYKLIGRVHSDGEGEGCIS